jgi:hypothetical protein
VSLLEPTPSVCGTENSLGSLVHFKTPLTRGGGYRYQIVRV